MTTTTPGYTCPDEILAEDLVLIPYEFEKIEWTVCHKPTQDFTIVAIGNSKAKRAKAEREWKDGTAAREIAWRRAQAVLRFLGWFGFKGRPEQIGRIYIEERRA